MSQRLNKRSEGDNNEMRSEVTAVRTIRNQIKYEPISQGTTSQNTKSNRL